MLPTEMEHLHNKMIGYKWHTFYRELQADELGHRLTVKVLTICAMTILGTDGVTISSILNLSTHAASCVFDFEGCIILDKLVRCFLLPFWCVAICHA